MILEVLTPSPTIINQAGNTKLDWLILGLGIGIAGGLGVIFANRIIEEIKKLK